jgi:hypothetical protein
MSTVQAGIETSDKDAGLFVFDASEDLTGLAVPEPAEVRSYPDNFDRSPEMSGLRRLLVVVVFPLARPPSVLPTGTGVGAAAAAAGAGALLLALIKLGTAAATIPDIELKGKCYNFAVATNSQRYTEKV